MQFSFKRVRGFTLIELLAVIAIIGILATLAAIGISTATKRARDARRQNDLRSVKEALELYNQDNGSYPTEVDFDGLEGDLVDGEYIQAWPTDPNPNFAGGGYSYTSNDGQDYVLWTNLEYKRVRNPLSSPTSCDDVDDETIKGNGFVEGGCFRLTND